jgi:hypothetical protein
MEEFNKLFQDAKKAAGTIDDGLRKLNNIKNLLKGAPSEQVQKAEEAIKRAEDLKKELDGYNGKK